MTIEFEGIQGGKEGEAYGDETWTYLFKSDDPNDTEIDVYRHPSCPRIYQKHPSFTWKSCRDLSHSQGSGAEWIKWEIEVTWKPIDSEKWPDGQPAPQPPVSAQEPPDGDPTTDDEEVTQPNFDADISVYFEEYSGPVEGAYGTVTAQTRGYGVADKFNVGIVASNGQPYDPPFQIEKQDAVIDVRVDVPTISPVFSLLDDYRNKVNTDGFQYIEGPYKIDVPARCGRMRYTLGPTQKFVTANVEGFYREVNIQIVVRGSTWLLRALDAGSYAISPEGDSIADRLDADPPDFDFAVSSYVPFEDDKGNSMLRLLNGTGGELTSGAPIFNEYKVRKENQFLALLTKIAPNKFKVL